MIIHTTEDIKDVHKTTVMLTLIFVVLPMVIHLVACYKVGGMFILWLGLFLFPMGILHGYQIVFDYFSLMF